MVAANCSYSCIESYPIERVHKHPIPLYPKASHSYTPKSELPHPNPSRLIATHCATRISQNHLTTRVIPHYSILHASYLRQTSAIDTMLTESSAHIEELVAVWEQCDLSVTVAASLGWRHRQLEEVEMEQKTVEKGLASEKAATTKMLAVLSHEGSSSKEAFLALKAAIADARSQSIDLTDELRVQRDMLSLH